MTFDRIFSVEFERRGVFGWKRSSSNPLQWREIRFASELELHERRTIGFRDPPGSEPLDVATIARPNLRSTGSRRPLGRNGSLPRTEVAIAGRPTNSASEKCPLTIAARAAT